MVKVNPSSYGSSLRVAYPHPKEMERLTFDWRYKNYLGSGVIYIHLFTDSFAPAHNTSLSESSATAVPSSSYLSFIQVRTPRLLPPSRQPRLTYS